MNTLMNLITQHYQQNQIIQYTSSEQQDQQHLRPIKKLLLPANQIIKKNYDLDTKASVKLITPTIRKSIKITAQKQSQNTLIQEILQKYYQKINFQSDDYLGYGLLNQLKQNKFTDVVYMKFNNRKFIKCFENQHKYIAGCFIPLTQLLKPQLKNESNLYTFLNKQRKSPFAQYKKSAQNSFGQNCFSNENEPKFSSNYQGSNLFMAIKKGNFEYDLILQNDINSKGTTQWFNFAISLFEQGYYKFNIINLTKSRSLFQKGMKIPYFSLQNKILNNISWTRGCQNIQYYKNQILRQGSQSRYYSNLHFEYNSVYKHDTVIFSSGFPYCSLQLQKFFNKITIKKISTIFNIDKIKICDTLSGLPVYVYQIRAKTSLPQRNSTLLSNTGTYSSKSFNSTLHQNFISSQHIQNSNLKNKQTKSIVFIGRQHPGQSQSSFVIEGIMQFLLENNQYDKSKKNFNYYIFPMLNVDGVYYGNYRTNLSGNDLNRIWKQPRKDFHSEVFFIKKYLHFLNKNTPIKLIIDIHGHSSSLNSFFYGNPVKKQNSNQIDNPKLFPYYCSKNINQISFLQSTFKISEQKKSSARVVLNQMFPKALVYTLQNSFYGYLKGKKVVQYTPEKYKKLGRNLMATYLQFCKISQRNVLFKDKLLKEIQELTPLKKNSNISVQSQSDSQAEQDLIEFQEQFKKIDEEVINSPVYQDEKNFNFKDKRNSSKNLRIYATKNRLQGRNQYKNRSSLSPKDNQFQAQKNESNTKTNLNMFHSRGFLSIVKIDTNKNLNQNNQKQKFFIYKNNEKQNSEKSGYFQPVKMDSIVQTKRRQSSIYDFKCINEKQYLLKMRKKNNQVLDQFDAKNYLKTLGFKKIQQGTPN